MIRFLFLLLLTGCAGKQALNIDSSMTAERGRELTLIFKGCDHGFTKGYLFCELEDGTIPLKEVSIFVPRTSCDRRSCVELHIVRPDGSFGYSVNVSQGSDSIFIPIEKIVGESLLIKRVYDGEYRVLARIFFKNEEGLEETVRLEGLIRIWIRENRYKPLACESPHLGWKNYLSNKCSAEFTTSGRSVLCGEC